MKGKTTYISPELVTIVLDGEYGVCQASPNDDFSPINGGAWDV